MTSHIKELTEALACSGISVRTTNIAETRHETAKLGGLWQNFYQNHVSHLEDGEDIYGVYHNYESDDVGAFDVVASWKTSSEQNPALDTADNELIPSVGDTSDLVTVTIPAGKYLVFSEQGNMPDTVMDAWEKVWSYFNDLSCAHTRTYNVDFEHYIGGNLEHGQVDLYISIE